MARHHHSWEMPPEISDALGRWSELYIETTLVCVRCGRTKRICCWHGMATTEYGWVRDELGPEAEAERRELLRKRNAKRRRNASA